MVILLLLIGHVGTLKHTPVDMMEVSHVYREDGEHCYTQLILWEWSPDYRRFNVMRWKLLDEPNEYPKKRGATYYVPGYKSRLFRQTWSQHDPEKRNKRLHSPEFRMNIHPGRTER